MQGSSRRFDFRYDIKDGVAFLVLSDLRPWSAQSVQCCISRSSAPSVGRRRRYSGISRPVEATAAIQIVMARDFNVPIPPNFPDAAASSTKLSGVMNLPRNLPVGLLPVLSSILLRILSIFSTQIKSRPASLHPALLARATSGHRRTC